MVSGLRTVACVAASIACTGCVAARAQNAPATAAVDNRQITSIGDALRRPGNEPLHLLYIHGIGATEPYDSSDLRVSICRALKDCVVLGGVATGREYADRGAFDPNAPVPTLTYMGQPLWRSREEWLAAAPFVDHYVIERRHAKTILLDELNWWPMVFSLKCRNMLPNETQMAGHDDAYLGLCAQNRPHTSDGVTGRYDRYPWITQTQADALTATENHGVILNRKLKVNLMDWRFADALLGVGPMGDLLVEGVRQLLMKSVSTGNAASAQITAKASAQLDPQAEYITISHSMGSYLIFSALQHGGQDGAPESADAERQRVFDYLLGHLTQAYFFANQIPLLELARLGTADEAKRMLDLKHWAAERRNVVASGALPATDPLAQIVAWSDPNDLLTWYLGEDFERWQAADGVKVANRRVKNARHWFWIVEGPTSAHDDYAKNREVIRELLKPLQPPQP